MDLNSIIFPAPTDDKRFEIFRYKEELMYIPKTQKDGSITYIPCLLQLSKKNPSTNKYLLYFHGNAEDIFNSTANIDLLRSCLPFHTISIEYPGYSVYYQEKSAEVIEDDSLIVYDYLTKVAGILPSDIVVLGRSIGSGPCVYLAGHRNPGGIILISPFKSIRETVGSLVGSFKFLVADRFKNIDVIKKVTSPTLFIHGQKDDLIPCSHSVDLSKNCGGPFDLIFPENMNHNEFNIYDDFLEPIHTFLKRYNFIQPNTNEKKVSLPSKVFEIPDIYFKYIRDTKGSKCNQNNDFISHYIRKLLKIS